VRPIGAKGAAVIFMAAPRATTVVVIDVRRPLVVVAAARQWLTLLRYGRRRALDVQNGGREFLAA
jgi:hypothetical protein